MQRTDFLKANGGEWVSIIQSRSFMDGMTLLSLERLEKIRSLSNQEIKDDAVIILSELRGALQHEADLFNLAQPPEEQAEDPTAPEYVDSIQENWEERQRLNQQP